MGKRNGCTACPRRCGGGFCHAPEEPMLARTGLHFGEEPCISGMHGSGTVFFSGCGLGCVYCQNFDVSRGRIGKIFSVRELADTFRALEDAGAHNINLVTPSHYVFAIAAALRLYTPRIPVVYNTSGYDTPEAIDLLAPFVSVWLTDCKYADPALAQALSGAADYPSVAMTALRRMREHCPTDTFDADGMLTRGVICRHLVLPGCSADSLAVLDAVAAVSPRPLLSLMSQYTPCGDLSAHPELSRRVTTFEYRKVLDRARALGFDGWMQDRAAASPAMIPRWGEFLPVGSGGTH